MGKGIVSVRLHNGATVEAEFEDNGDGKVDQGEITRAQDALAEKLNGMTTDYVDLYTEASVLDSGRKAGDFSKKFSVGNLVSRGVTQLFRPSAQVTANLTAPADWAVERSDDEYTYYREMARWDPEKQQHVFGRSIRVPDWGEAEIEIQGDRGSTSWMAISSYPGKENLPDLDYLEKDEIGDTSKVEITPVSWGAPQLGKDGYVYFQGADGSLSRRSAARPVNVEVSDQIDPTAGPKWRAADDQDQVPFINLVEDVSGQQPQYYNLAYGESWEGKGSNTGYEEGYTYSTTTTIGSGEAKILRRKQGTLSGSFDGPYEVQVKNDAGQMSWVSVEQPASPPVAQGTRRHSKKAHRKSNGDLMAKKVIRD